MVLCICAIIRKVLAWRLSNAMDASFCVEYLDGAIKDYGVPEIFKPTKAHNLPVTTSPAYCNTIASPSAWADICSCNICIPRIHVVYGHGHDLANIFVIKPLPKTGYNYD
ncbi:MAG: hypothetical protein HOO92_14555 [Methylococcaceae bacterium]|nr:hypothetical protein [Methylococcaceae bacterium]